MSWWHRLIPKAWRKRERQVMMLNSEEFHDLIGRGYTRLDQNIDVKTCVKRIAELISSMTIHLMQNTEKGDVRVTNGLSRKLDIEPWRYGTRKTLYYKSVEELMLTGNAILLPHIGRDGYLEELLPIPQSEVMYNDHLDGSYSITWQGETYQDDEIVHFVYNPDPEQPWLGRSFQIYLDDILKNLNESQTIKNDFYTKYFKPNLIFTIEADSDLMQSEEGRQKVYEKWLSTPPGVPYMLPGELIQAQVVQPLTLSSIAINESVELDKRSIANLFGIPPFMLGIGVYHVAEYNAFIDAVISPIAQVLAQELTRKLIVSPDLYIKFNLQSIRAFGLEARLASLYQGKALGIFSANEIRIAAGYEPVEQAEMDEFTLLENYVPTQDLGNQKKLVQEKTPSDDGGDDYEA